MFAKLGDARRNAILARFREYCAAMVEGRSDLFGHITACEAHIDELERQVAELTKERDDLKEQTRCLESEAVACDAAKEPRDNGDGTVTELLPVTYPAEYAARVVEVRNARSGDITVSLFGSVSTAHGHELGVRLILSPSAPAPEQIAWVAPLADGEHRATGDGIHSERYFFRWNGGAARFRVLTKPPKPGRCLFKDGVGTWQGDA